MAYTEAEWKMKCYTCAAFFTVDREGIRDHMGHEFYTQDYRGKRRWDYEWADNAEALSHAGKCEVCWHELRDPVPPSTKEPIFIHAAFYSVECRLWWLCAEHAEDAKTWLFPSEECDHETQQNRGREDMDERRL